MLDKSGSKLSVCRAFYKLSEVLHEDPSIRTTLSAATETGVCIDIGASPGGWTDLLSRHARVIAIDPGEISAEIVSRANVTHLRMMLDSDETSATRLREALRPAARASVVVCDANIAPATAASLVSSLAARDLLLPGSKLVLTLKAQAKVRSKSGERVRRAHEAEAVAALGRGFGDVTVRHLFANTQHESTLTATFVGC